MKLSLVFFMLIAFALSSNGQSWGDSSVKKLRIYESVEEAPSFPGGTKGFYDFLAKNLKEPENKFSMFSNKLVLVKIVINSEGHVVYAEIEKSVNVDYDLSAIQLIEKMPTWRPGKQNKKPVLCYVTLPFVFVNGH